MREEAHSWVCSTARSPSSPARDTASGADTRWVTYPGGDGPGAGKHIVLVAGDEEYRSEEELPQLANHLRLIDTMRGFNLVHNVNEINFIPLIRPIDFICLAMMGKVSSFTITVMITMATP